MLQSTMQGRLQLNPRTAGKTLLPAGRRSMVCSAVTSSTRQAASPQQQLSAVAVRLAATAAALHLATMPANAMWDGTSSAIGSCPIMEAGDECRMQVLKRDEGKLGSYATAANNAAKLSGKATGMPVAQLGSDYVADTNALSETILKYAQLDVYDEQRPQLIKNLKLQGQSWASKYARGGSARTLSARRIYIAVDALQGHLASNGFAPYPRNKVIKLVSDIEEGQRLLAEGK